jgi:hypothetical protein
MQHVPSGDETTGTMTKAMQTKFVAAAWRNEGKRNEGTESTKAAMEHQGRQ